MSSKRRSFRNFTLGGCNNPRPCPEASTSSFPSIEAKPRRAPAWRASWPRPSGAARGRRRRRGPSPQSEGCACREPGPNQPFRPRVEPRFVATANEGMRLHPDRDVYSSPATRPSAWMARSPRRARCADLSVTDRIPFQTTRLSGATANAQADESGGRDRSELARGSAGNTDIAAEIPAANRYASITRGSDRIGCTAKRGTARATGKRSISACVPRARDSSTSSPQTSSYGTWERCRSGTWPRNAARKPRPSWTSSIRNSSRGCGTSSPAIHSPTFGAGSITCGARHRRSPGWQACSAGSLRYHPRREASPLDSAVQREHVDPHTCGAHDRVRVRDERGGDVQLPLRAADGAVGVRHPPEALPSADAGSAHRDPRHRREEPQCRGPMAVEPQQERGNAPPAIRQVQGARGGLRHRVPGARHELRAHEPRRHGEERAEGRRGFPARARCPQALPRLRPDLRRRNRQQAWSWASSSAERSRSPVSCLPTFNQNVREVGRRPQPATGYSGNIRRCSGAGGPPLPAARLRRNDPPRADVHALRRWFTLPSRPAILQTYLQCALQAAGRGLQSSAASPRFRGRPSAMFASRSTSA